MNFSSLNECTLGISDEDIIQAMKQIPGYLDITPSDFMEVYHVAFQHAISRIQNAFTADQIMTKQVITVFENTPLIEAIIKMAENNISGLLVLKADQTVSGVISEKDFLKKMNSETVPSLMHMILRCVDTKGCMAVGLKALNAVDIMSFPCVTVKPQTPVMKIANLMDQKNINRVPVINDRFELVGIITRSDIVQTMC